MNSREKLRGTLGFQDMEGEGSVLETFFPWDLTVRNFIKDGLSEKFVPEYLYPEIPEGERERRYLADGMADPVWEYEQSLGFDGVKRMSFQIPFEAFCKEGNITDWDSWKKLKAQVTQELEKWCTDENIIRIYGRYREGHEKGDYSIRLRASGFFWTPRTLFGVEEHLYAFYDEPGLMHDINRFVLEVYLKYLTKITDILQPEVLLFPEDLSGKNGPMLSPDCFDEFVGAYYKELFPVLRKHGTENIFVDTDGDFQILIPNFMDAGVDGFLPMDVNAGMDIVEVRKKHPKLKFIGGYNKLELLGGKEAIDREFLRILPVVRQGGYIPGLDHQAAPQTRLEDYRYYIGRLKEVMKEAGKDSLYGKIR